MLWSPFPLEEERAAELQRATRISPTLCQPPSLQVKWQRGSAAPRIQRVQRCTRVAHGAGKMVREGVCEREPVCLSLSRAEASDPATLVTAFLVIALCVFSLSQGRAVGPATTTEWLGAFWNVCARSPGSGKRTSSAPFMCAVSSVAKGLKLRSIWHRFLLSLGSPPQHSGFVPGPQWGSASALCH